MKQPLLTIGLLATIVAAGCKPAKVMDTVDIKANETAWMIPLDADNQSAQSKFNSIDYLNQKKVATKRVWIDKVERQTGRFYWDMEWIPAVRLVRVDRSLVSRVWTDNPNTGTSHGSQGIPVNTKDNIKLTVGLAVTLSITEEDASTFLWYHGEVPLAQVADNNVYNYAVAELNKQVSSMTLSEFQQNQAQIYATLFKDAVDMFKSKGITVQYLGNAEGWHFSDPAIQDSINRTFIAQQDNVTAQKQQDAQRTRNATDMMNVENQNRIKVANAQAEVDAANKLLAAKEASAFQIQLQISKMNAEAMLKWDGHYPSNILPANSPMLLNMNPSQK
jgi:hypothetical protein